RHTRSKRDWSSDVCSSDLLHLIPRLILAKVLDVDKNYIYLNGNEEVPIDRYNKFMKIIEERARAYPFQYLLGKQEFMGLDFQIRSEERRVGKGCRSWCRKC